MPNEAKVKLDDAVAKVADLPVLPATAQKVMRLMSDPDVSIEKIKRIISTDPGLTARVLKIANSAFYGGHRNIQNLTQAILRLGLNSVRNTVVATSMKNVYKRFGLSEKLLWEQTLGSAIVASIIARHTRLADPEDAFIAGLLHDVGKVLLNNEYQEQFAMVMERIYNDSVTYQLAEKEVFDFSQREVGALVVRKWGFPESIEMLLRHFDNPNELSKDRTLYNLVTIITLADRMCQKFGMGWRRPFGDAVDLGNLPEELGLSAQDMAEFTERVKTAFDQQIELY